MYGCTLCFSGCESPLLLIFRVLCSTTLNYKIELLVTPSLTCLSDLGRTSGSPGDDNLSSAHVEFTYKHVALSAHSAGSMRNFEFRAGKSVNFGAGTRRHPQRSDAGVLPTFFTCLGIFDPSVLYLDQTTETSISRQRVFSAHPLKMP